MRLSEVRSKGKRAEVTQNDGARTVEKNESGGSRG